MKQTLEIKKKHILLGVLALVVIGGLFYSSQRKDTTGIDSEILSTYNTLSPQAKALYYQQSEQLTKPVSERIVQLDQLTIGCFSPAKIQGMPSADHLGGQCCGALKNPEAYKLQLQALDTFIKENGNSDLIPKDPYDVSVEHAKKLITFDSEITLNENQQKIYDAAMKMSHHGGPCCCKCWKWYMMSGLAKKLIVDSGWDEHKIAELWDTSSSCGHDEDTNMHEHYHIGSKTEEAEHTHHTS